MSHGRRPCVGRAKRAGLLGFQWLGFRVQVSEFGDWDLEGLQGFSPGFQMFCSTSLEPGFEKVGAATHHISFLDFSRHHLL